MKLLIIFFFVKYNLTIIVTVRYSKTAFNILKLLTQSKIINPELELVEKPNSFNIESVTIEHPDAVTKLSNPIKRKKYSSTTE